MPATNSAPSSSGAHQLTLRTASSISPRRSGRSCGVKLSMLRCTSLRTVAHAGPSGTLNIDPWPVAPASQTGVVTQATRSK
jgi:hypothetical protein